MNFLKLCKFIAGLIALVGFFLMVCAVGTSDYMDVVGECYPFTKMLPTAVIGLVLMVSGVLGYKYLNDGWYDED